MTTAGGGWTLVGRSAAGGTGAFGWNSSQGTFTNDAVPYSLGNTAALSPTQALFGNYSGNLTWGGYIYQQTLPAGFPGSWSTAVTLMGRPLPIAGGNTVFGMTQVVGDTSRTDAFFLRDNLDTSAIYGLKSNGWATGYRDTGTVGGVNSGNNVPIGWGGYVNAQQGWMFVR
jgi:hypothetical protein